MTIINLTRDTPGAIGADMRDRGIGCINCPPGSIAGCLISKYSLAEGKASWRSVSAIKVDSFTALYIAGKWRDVMTRVA